MVSAAKSSPLPEPDYAWDIARLYPPQGMWPEFEYLFLTDQTNKLVEFTDGNVEVLAMPTKSHQKIVAFLYRLLFDFITAGALGEVFIAGIRVRLRPGMIREPDVTFMSSAHASRAGEDFFEGADLVIEVVSEDEKSRNRDLVQKRREYAESGIPEYWIVDHLQRRITVLKLANSEYAVHGEFAPGQLATSALLPGFKADVSAVFAAAK